MPLTKDGDYVDDTDTYSSDDGASSGSDDDGSFIDNYLGGNLNEEQRDARAEGAFLPSWLTAIKDDLIAITSNPRGFVIGTILSVVIGYVLELWNLVIDVVRLVLFGAEPGYSPGELMGLEDIVWVLWDIVGTSFTSVADAILGSIEGFRTTIEALATQLGIFSFPATVAFVVFLLVVATRVVGKISRASLASVPIIGPALEVFLYE